MLYVSCYYTTTSSSSSDITRRRVVSSNGKTHNVFSRDSNLINTINKRNIVVIHIGIQSDS